VLTPHPRLDVQIHLGSRVLQLEIPGENQVLAVSHVLKLENRVLVVSHVVQLEIPEWRTRGPPRLIVGAPG